MASLGELERAVMDAVWDSVDPLSAYDVQAQLEKTQERTLAVTTVLTVLSRLAKKQFVTVDRSVRPHRYSPSASRAEHVAELMHEVLGESPDRVAVLERFVGGVSDQDAALLRKLLRGSP